MRGWASYNVTIVVCPQHNNRATGAVVGRPIPVQEILPVCATHTIPNSFPGARGNPPPPLNCHRQSWTRGTRNAERAFHCTVLHYASTRRPHRPITHFSDRPHFTDTQWAKNGTPEHGTYAHKVVANRETTLPVLLPVLLAKLQKSLQSKLSMEEPWPGLLALTPQTTKKNQPYV